MDTMSIDQMPATKPAPLTTTLDMALFDAMTAPETVPELQPGCTLDSLGYVRLPPRPNRATRRAEAAQGRRTAPPKQDRNAVVRANFKTAADLDDFGPNRHTGHCPACQRRTFHVGGSQQECENCNWSGPVPDYNQPESAARFKRHFALNGKTNLDPRTI